MLFSQVLEVSLSTCRYILHQHLTSWPLKVDSGQFCLNFTMFPLAKNTLSHLQVQSIQQTVARHIYQEQTPDFHNNHGNSVLLQGRIRPHKLEQRRAHSLLAVSPQRNGEIGNHPSWCSTELFQNQLVIDAQWKHYVAIKIWHAWRNKGHLKPSKTWILMSLLRFYSCDFSLAGSPHNFGAKTNSAHGLQDSSPFFPFPTYKTKSGVYSTSEQWLSLNDENKRSFIL